MDKVLLLGNGINFNASDSKFSNTKIKDRFLYQYMNELPKIEYDDLRNELTSARSTIDLCDGNIEQIAAAIFDYVNKSFCSKVGYFSGNHEQRIKTFLKKVALNAIFIDGGKFIDLNLFPEIVRNINKYEVVMTLNYYEYWDTTKRAIHLHGRIEIDNDEVKNYRSCIFSPLLGGLKSTSDALHPSKHLCPSKDLFPMGAYELYKELEGLNYINLFGVSPYGDKELIEKLVKIPNINIYIYDNNEDEVRIWSKKIPHATLIDSKKFVVF